MTRLAQRTLAAVGAWWLASFAAFIAVPVAADYIRKRREATLVGQMQNFPQPPADATEAALQRIQNSRCGR
jgi:hypothetical protein